VRIPLLAFTALASPPLGGTWAADAFRGTEIGGCAFLFGESVLNGLFEPGLLIEFPLDEFELALDF
jgi:hypothetical protein